MKDLGTERLASLTSVGRSIRVKRLRPYVSMVKVRTWMTSQDHPGPVPVPTWCSLCTLVDKKQQLHPYYIWKLFYMIAKHCHVAQVVRIGL